ncbi:MAG TPA: tRNA (guanosine(46)-N7)-methyltransferase TrmB [Bacteroidales bacterium]|nr:tRNA (guanosine(46)-N7)-methyltransferase TrmB [Bacteroidales bacterium]
MSKKNKLYRFAENETFDNMFQLAYEDVIDGFELRDNWTSNFFKNNNNLIIELGCGKGEYTTGLAQMFPANNFIGIDIKGARIWRGLVTSDDRSLKNVAFIRSRINLIEYFFGNNEVSEIWITFPDPHPSRIKEKRRLTSPQFLNRYYKILKTDGVIHLKTDNIIFFEYTMDVIRDHGHDLLYTTYDVYGEENDKALTQIQTFYEKKWLNRGTKIKYLKFKLIPL